MSAAAAVVEYEFANIKQRTVSERAKTLFWKWYLRTQIDLYSLRTGTFVVRLSQVKKSKKEWKKVRKWSYLLQKIGWYAQHKDANPIKT